MKKQIIYIHGGDSFSVYEDFLTYLRTTPLREPLGSIDKPRRWTDGLAEALGPEYELIMPSMPNKHNAHYEEWAIWFERHLDLVDNGVILIGWSLGGMFLAKYLSETSLKKFVRAAFLLAAPSGGFVPVDGTGDDCGQFKPDESKIVNIATHVPQVEFWHSHDDFVVPVKEIEWYRVHVPGAHFRFFEDKNHFLVESLPELIEAVKSL